MGKWKVVGMKLESQMELKFLSLLIKKLKSFSKQTGLDKQEKM